MVCFPADREPSEQLEAGRVRQLKSQYVDREPSTSPSLLQRARDGDADGWKKIAQLYGPVVYAWIRRSGLQSSDAADVMQETLLAVAGGLQKFDCQRGGSTFRGWLWVIARNKMRDHLRREKERAAGGTEAQLRLNELASAPEDRPDESENTEPPCDSESDLASVRRRTIEMLRDQFDPRSWRMFWETTACQRDPGEVATEMGVSRWAVYKARSRVLHRLRQELDGLT